MTKTTNGLTDEPTETSSYNNSQRSEPNEYAQLKRLVKSAGLLDKNPGHYAVKMTVTMSLLALSVAVLTTVDSVWIQVVNAAFLAFIITQLCFLGHDLGHKQVFRSSQNNDRVGLLVSFLVGINRTWWVEKHNEHHSNPNDLDLDPDVDLPLIAFSEEQARGMKGIPRFIVTYQAFLFYPLVCFEGLVLKISGIRYMFGNRLMFPVAEPMMMIGHIGAYAGLVFLSLPFWQGLLFIAVNQMLIGLYIGSTFAPNHKGMLTLDGNTKLDFLRKQVLTSRNVKSSPLNDLLYGGLNYQIEHHLFPSMPRNRLKDAQRIVMPFCQKHSISYYETGVVRSQREILQYLHHVSAPLRA
ncbi:MAG: acyl-CoA desaturase [Dehalococcoidia bacterium]|nr:acyl-CoA desaturase [Dehalococcoidia bacterium]